VDVVASATTICRTGSGDSCDPDESCTGVADEACPDDVQLPDGDSCLVDDDGLDDCVDPACVGGVCDQEAGDEVVCDPTCELCNPDGGACEPTGACEDLCRTAGFWATHAEEAPPKAFDLTGDAITLAGGQITVCGVVLTDSTAAMQAMCISPEGDPLLQLARQLTAAALNCAITDGTCSVEGLIADCENTCVDGSGTRDVDVCTREVDCFNNGDYWDGAMCWSGTCELEGTDCNTDSECPLITGTEVHEACVPFANTCHTRDICEGDFCEETGKAGSSKTCNDLKKDQTTIFDLVP
jgi:hypothetical protein